MPLTKSQYINLALIFMAQPFADVAAEQQNLNLSNTSVAVAFSPDDGITQMITNEIDQAKKSIAIAAYSFTSIPIAHKLIEAKKRGVIVQVLLDQSQRKAKGSVARLLKQSGVAVRFNKHYKIQHNKYMVFDERHVECGSFNYTHSAEKKNAENALLIKDEPKLAHVYLVNFKKLWHQSFQSQRNISTYRKALRHRIKTKTKIIKRVYALQELSPTHMPSCLLE